MFINVQTKCILCEGMSSLGWHEVRSLQCSLSQPLGAAVRTVPAGHTGECTVIKFCQLKIISIRAVNTTTTRFGDCGKPIL